MANKRNNLSLNFKIERSNDLNRLNPKGMNLTEIRFLAIYQAKINARKPETRTVTFPLADFCKIMEVKELNVAHIKNIADKIICKPVHIPDGKGGVYVVPLFNKCYIRKDEKIGEWLVDIRCSQEVMPYMFEMKRNYFTYELWNALKLKSVNQVRMYETLKQYEKLGVRTIELNELKSLLGIDISQYDRYQDFRRKVLELCQQSLEQYTDIKFTFEPIKQGRKIHSLKFTITKNKDFKDDLKLKEFIKPEDLEDIQDIPIGVETVENTVENRILQSKEQQYPDLVTRVYQKCQKSYTMEQVQNLLDMAEMISDNPSAYIVNLYHTIRAYNTKINNMYNYTLSVIQANLSKKSTLEQEKPSKKKKKRETSYNLKEFMEFTRLNTINAIANNYPQEEEQELNSPQEVEKTSNYQGTNLEEIDKEFEEALASGEIPF